MGEGEVKKNQMYLNLLLGSSEDLQLTPCLRAPMASEMLRKEEMHRLLTTMFVVLLELNPGNCIVHSMGHDCHSLLWRQ